MKINNGTVLLFFISVNFVSVQAQKNSEWKIVKDQQGVEISYRWLTAANDARAREMRTIFHIPAQVPAIVKQFKDPEKYQEWQPAVEKCTINMLTEDRWDTYVKFDLPWPFKSKDLVTRTNFSEAESYSTISILSTPKARPEVENVNRINDLKAEWKLFPMHNGSTKVIYTTISYDKPEFPRMIADPILQKKLIESIGLLKSRATR